MRTYDLRLERAALFCCLAHDAQSILPSLLSPDDFHDREVGQIFTAIQKHFADKGACTVPDLSTSFDLVKLLSLLDEGAAVPNLCAEDIAKAMRELRIRRTAQEFQITTQEAKDMIQELSDHAEKLTALLPTARRDTLDVFNELHESPPPVIPMGFSQLDAMLSMHAGDLVTVGARTSHGKTAFLINVAANILRKMQRVDFLTREMKDTELLPRFIANLTGKPHPQGLECIDTELIDKLHIHNFRSIQDIESICSKTDAGLICIDYIQLIDSGRSSENRVSELEYVTGHLKAAAMQSNKCILSAAQLNRTIDNAGRQPILSDLRGSGSIEQDSNAVLLLYNHAKDTKEEQTARALDGTQNMVDVYIAKNRVGQTGKVQLHWNPQLCQFTTPYST